MENGLMLQTVSELDSYLPQSKGLILTDIKYFPNYTDRKEDYLCIVYKDGTGAKNVRSIKAPKLPVYFVDDQYKNYDYNKSSIELDKTHLEMVSNNSLVFDMVKHMEPSYQSFIRNVVESKNYKALKDIHKYPYVFGSDIDITVPYKMTWLLNHNDVKEKRMSKIFLDIEVDTSEIVGFPESGSCPINAITIIDEESATSFTFLLDGGYPGIPNFKENINQFISELHQDFDEFYGYIDYKIRMYDDEVKLIKDALLLLNTLNRDFIMIWNIRFDAPFLIERLRRLGHEPDKYFSHPDFPFPYVHFYEKDDQNKSIAGRGDAMTTASYSKWYCQMKLYAGMRKGQKELRSTALTSVAHDEIGDEKLDYSEESNIKTFHLDNYWKFVKYNIKDVLLQLGIERKVHDVDSLYARTYSNITPYDMVFKQTIILKNRVYMEYLLQGYIMGNTIPGEPIKFSGGLVGNPLLNNYKGLSLFGNPSMFIFKNVIDFDFSSMYPFIMIAFNIERCTMIGKLIILDDIFKEDYIHIFDEVTEYYMKKKTVNDMDDDLSDDDDDSTDIYDPGADFIDNYSSHDTLSFGTKWFKLPEYSVVKNLYEEYMTKTYSVTDCHFTREWINKVTDLIHVENGQSKDHIRIGVSNVCGKYFYDASCEIHNNYIHKTVKMTLSKLIDYIERTRPILGGHGVLYKNQKEVNNPLITTIQKFISTRKSLKKQLAFVEDKTSYEYMTIDREQLTEKIMVNSLYGAFGSVWSFLFNQYTAPSVTKTGRSLISTACMAFESFLGDNVKFNNLNEMYTFVYNIINEDKFLDDSFLPKIKKIDLVNRLNSNFYSEDESNLFAVAQLVENLTESQVSRIYFKNNLYAFSNLPETKGLLGKVISEVKEFKDPNKVPAEIKEYMETLWAYYKEFVFYNHLYSDKLYRTKNDYRNSVIIIDTDSNMINVNPWNDFINAQIIPNITPAAENDDELNFINVNIMAYLVTNMIGCTLEKYTKNCNILEDFRPMINMKNEFLFSIVYTATKKKRYISNILLREGDFIKGGKLDVKGFDFVKSSTSKNTSKKLQGIIKECLIDSKIPDVPKMVYYINGMENDIKASIANGDRYYFLPKSVKEIDAYKDPLSEQGIRAVLNWNMIYPDQAIALPVKIDIVKLTLDNNIRLERLKRNYPEIYDSVEKNILNNKNKRIRDKKLHVIAIPRNIEKIPQWILDNIDVSAMINSNTKQLYPIMYTLNCKVDKNSKTSFFSNIIEF